MMIDKGTRPYLLNRMWNLKVDQAQAKIVELQALLKHLGLEKVNTNLSRYPDEMENDETTIPVDAILESMFIQVIRKKKSM